MTIPLLSFAPNWSTSYKVGREFKTTVQTSRSGKEQRRALRNHPRKTVSFTATVFASDMVAINRELAKNIGYSLYLLDETRWVSLTADMGPNGLTATLDGAPEWLLGWVVLRHNGVWELRQVNGLSGNTVTFATSSSNDWPVGARVYPALQGTLAKEIKINLRSDAAQDVQIEFNVTPTSEPVITPPAASTTWNGREVFLTSPNWQTDPNVTIMRPLETVDYGYGAMAYFNPVAFMSRIQQATWLEMSSDQVSALEDVFLRAKGQRGEFYMPTWTSDVTPAVVAAAGTSQLTVAGTDFYNDYAGDSVFTNLCIWYIDGTFQFVQVNRITTDGTNSQIQATAPFTRSIDPGIIRMISWMPCCRFASDGMTTEWMTNAVARAQLSIMSLEDLAAEIAP